MGCWKGVKMVKTKDKLRVLYISNSHPDLYVGGAEVYAYSLYKGMRDVGDFEPIFLARSTTPAHHHRHGTVFRTINDDPNQVLWFQEQHDYFFVTSPDKEQYTVHLHNFLTAFRPDVVHIQHTIGMGVDLIRQIKNSLPGTPIVYTLHELLPICNAHGFMLRTDGKELCREASPTRCHECFQDIPAQHFFLRERFIKSQFRHVDLFLAPSHFLVQRYREWGIPADKIRCQENGRILPDSGNGASDGGADDPPTGNIAFFGQLMPHKGLLVLLEAMKLLLDEDAESDVAGATRTKKKSRGPRVAGGEDIHLFLSGANLDKQPDGFRNKVADLLEECTNVTFRGEYKISELSKLTANIAWVVVPSIWWENSPMVIQEAFMFKRPVICSNIGGMAEKIEDGVNGLHFQVDDPRDLAETLVRAATSVKLWKKLQAGIEPVYSIEEAVEVHGSLYRSLIAKAGEQV